MHKAPVWGRAIGIIMIILGSLGVFYQFYKIALYSIMRVQSKVMDGFETIVQENNSNNNVIQDQIFRSTKEIFQMTEEQGTMLSIIGVIGLFTCVFYIIGGAKLLKAKPANYNFGKFALLIFLIYNFFSFILIFTTGFSLIVFGLMVYAMIGFVFDIVLFIIVMASKKSDYGIGLAQAPIEVYSSRPDDNEVI